MPLALDFQIERTNLICQENPTCQIVASNNSSGVIKVASPAISPEVPILRVVELKTGIETFQQRHKHGGAGGISYQDVAAGRVLTSEFGLNSIARLPLPVEYELSAILPYDLGTQRAESKAIKLKIAPVTPRDVSVVNVQGGWAAIAYAVSVNAAADPPQIVRHRFDLVTEGGVGDARVVAKASLRAQPVLSAPPNQAVTHAHWVVWRDNDKVAFTHFDSALGSLPTGTWASPAPEFEIVSPAATEPVTDPARRPNGAALILLSDADRRASRFQVLNFGSDGKASVGASGAGPASRPAWMMSHINSKGGRWLTFIEGDGKNAVLFSRPWPQPNAPGEARALARWPGTCHGAGAIMVADDSVHGATLVRGESSGGAQVQLVAWTINPEGQFKERARHPVAWPFQSPITRAVVRSGPGGKAVALLAGADGQWQYFDDEAGLSPVPGGAAMSKLPIDIVFMSEAEPVLVIGRMSQGFDLMQPNGDPLPGHAG